jgi:hypothetical protein
VNNGEPLFCTRPNMGLLMQALFKARGIYEFRVSGPQVSFYIRPADGFQLPDIMQWMKQTFAVRSQIRFADLLLEFYASHKTPCLEPQEDGAYLGDRYWSKILDGEPLPDAEEYVF